VTNDRSYLAIVDHYESCLEKHGDTHRGVDWPREGETLIRHAVMHDLFREDPSKSLRVLDFGCGASHFYDFLVGKGAANLAYTGLDLSEKFIELSRSKHPGNEYLYLDVLDPAVSLPTFDFVVANGVFTQKRGLSQESMWEYFQKLVKVLAARADKGLAFNVMTPLAEWEHQEAFHLGFEKLGNFLAAEVSRDFTFRHNYGLYEYTTYVRFDKKA
jgi:SAM-dependent methyltransferase